MVQMTLFGGIQAKLWGSNNNKMQLHPDPMISRALRLLPLIPAVLLMACEEEASTAARGGWGGPAKVVTEQVEQQHYIGLVDAVDDLQVEVQKVDHPSRVHLDIETDDIDAEVARLEALGASALQRVRTVIKDGRVYGQP